MRSCIWNAHERSFENRKFSNEAVYLFFPKIIVLPEPKMLFHGPSSSRRLVFRAPHTFDGNGVRPLDISCGAEMN